MKHLKIYKDYGEVHAFALKFFYKMVSKYHKEKGKEFALHG